jgi:hypothetical protein
MPVSHFYRFFLDAQAKKTDFFHFLKIVKLMEKA